MSPHSLLLLAHKTDLLWITVSMKAGGVGLNLTAANRVILLDLGWSPASKLFETLLICLSAHLFVS